MSKTVIDKITGAGVVEFSPANTSPDFTDYPDKGLYFRTAPSDVLQGRVLGNLIVEDGNATVGILALQDAYGTGLADNITEAVTGSQGEVPETVIYDPKAAEFSAEVSKIKAADPDAIVVIGFDESAKIIPELVKQGIGPQQGKKLYLVDGNIGNALGEKVPAGRCSTASRAPSPAPRPPATSRPASRPSTRRSRTSTTPVSPTTPPCSPRSRPIAPRATRAPRSPSKLVEVSRGGEKCTTFAAASRCSRPARTSTTTASAARSSSAPRATRSRPPSTSAPTTPPTRSPRTSCTRRQARGLTARTPRTTCTRRARPRAAGPSRTSGTRGSAQGNGPVRDRIVDMKDLGVMAIGIVVFSVLTYGIVAIGDERTQGSNTKNGVMVGPPAPDGVEVDVNRIHAPEERAPHGGGEG